eukprot:1147496-Pelagomonas_calceolata.AAC.4
MGMHVHMKKEEGSDKALHQRASLVRRGSYLHAAAVLSPSVAQALVGSNVLPLLDQCIGLVGSNGCAAPALSVHRPCGQQWLCCPCLISALALWAAMAVLPLLDQCIGVVGSNGCAALAWTNQCLESLNAGQTAPDTALALQKHPHPPHETAVAAVPNLLSIHPHPYLYSENGGRGCV